MAFDFDVTGNTKLDTSGFTNGISSMTVAAGNLIADFVKSASSKMAELVTSSVDIGSSFETALAKVGTIAGCYITDGEIHREDKVRIVRDGTVVFEGEIASLRRFKDDVKTVKQGYECGIGISGYQDLKVGDTIEGYVVKEVERTE